VTAPAPDRHRLRLIMAALVAAVLLASLDGMIFNTALPTIVDQLHGIAHMSRVPTAYLLTTAITMPVYGWMSVAGAVVVAVALVLLSLLRVSTPPWVVGAAAYLFGAGMGFGMQTLTIVAQNAFPAEVGTATASFAFFREIGAALGAAAVGGLFTAQLTALLGARLPARLGDAHSLTPALVTTLPADLRERVAGAYHDALTPVFLGLAPMMLAAAVLLLFVRERHADTAHPEDPARGLQMAERTPAPSGGEG
jgi:MFS family permease